MKEQERIQNFSKQTLEQLYHSEDGLRIYEELIQFEPRFRQINARTFQTEFLCAQLAFSCMIWQQVSLEHHLNRDDQSKALLRSVMTSFESPKSLNIAAQFSEYYQAYHVTDEETPAIAIAKRLLEKTGFQADKNSLHVLKRLIEILEYFRIQFENMFSDFVEEQRSSF